MGPDLVGDFFFIEVGYATACLSADAGRGQTDTERKRN